MSDTLSHIRRVRRYVDSQNRKALKKKMDKYNSLSNKTVGAPDYDAQRAKTTNDVIAETLAIAKQGNTRRARAGFSDSSDRLLSECNVVQPEVRSLWQQKIGMASLLTDDVRLKLKEMPVSNIREARLCDLARWMVTQWCDVEGYDPAKHLKTIR